MRSFLGVAVGAVVVWGCQSNPQVSGEEETWQFGSGVERTCTTQGAIRDRHLALGGDGSVLGHCTTNELSTPDGLGRFNHFQFGSIYWSPATGAHEVYGAIGQRWAALGWERSSLGYPTGGEFDTAEGRQADFQHGALRWNRTTGAVTVVTSGSELCAVPPGADPRVFTAVSKPGTLCSRVPFPLAAPRAVLETKDGSLFVTEQRAGRLVKLEPTGFSMLAHSLLGPIGAVEDADGSLLVTEEGGHRLTRIQRNGDKRVLADALNNATYLTLGSDGAAYVSSFTDFAPTGVVRRIALDGSSGAGGSVVATGLNVPEGLFFDDSGALFVAEWGAAPARVLKFPPGTGTATAAQIMATGLEHIYGLISDREGGFFAADTANRVLHVRADKTVEVVLSNVAAPSGLALASNGDLLVLELVALDFNANGHLIRVSLH